MDYKNFTIRFFSSLAFIVFYFILYFFYTDTIIYFVALIYFLIVIEIVKYFKKSTYSIILYISLSFLFLLIYFILDFNPIGFTTMIFIISCFDSSSYLVGKIFGKNKIFYKVSPNKTYEGLLGGIIITNLVLLFFSLNFDFFKTNINFNFFIFINLIIVFSFFGDLIQSYFKRINNLKDSSNFLPGHGGLFDRFDSFLLVIIPYSTYYVLF